MVGEGHSRHLESCRPAASDDGDDDFDDDLLTEEVVRDEDTIAPTDIGSEFGYRLRVA